MVQWINRLRNNIFVNPPPLPFHCVKFLEPYTYRNRVLRQTGLQAGRLADKIQKISKLPVG